MDIVFDVETTGIPTKRNASFRELSVYDNARIVSIAWIVLDGNSRIDQQYHIIKPNKFIIPEGAIKVHGITNEFAHQVGISIEKCIRYIREVFAKYNIVRFVAHNVSFDFNVILSELHRYGNAHDMISRFFRTERYCTMKAGREYMQIKKFPRLSDLYVNLTQKTFEGAHNAAADAEACCVVFKIMRQKRRLTIQ